MNKLTAEKCREQFEEWFSKHYCIPGQFCRHDKSGDYENLTVRASWRAWQASRAALPILEQQERGEGWIEWSGGNCPVHPNLIVETKWGDGDIIIQPAGNPDWMHDSTVNIIAYRIIPEQPTNQNGEQ